MRSNHAGEGRDPFLMTKSMFYVYMLASQPCGTLYIGMASEPPAADLGAQEQGRPGIFEAL
jgi:hypothetical protein